MTRPSHTQHATGSGNESAQPLPMWRIIGVSLTGLVLVWLIATRTLAAALAPTSPETSLFLQPREPQALLILARTQLEARLKSAQVVAGLASGTEAGTGTGGQAGSGAAADGFNGDRLSQLSRLAEMALLKQNGEAGTENAEPAAPDLQTSGTADGTAPVTTTPVADIPAIRRLAARAIDAAPLNGEALEILGQLEELSGRAEPTEKLMRAASRVSLRQSYAVYWLLNKAEKDNDLALLMKTADILLKTRGGAAPLAVPALARVAEKGGLETVIDLLKTNPSWRGTFFRELPRSITDVRTPMYLLEALKASEHPPQKKELGSYLQFLLMKKYHELAYYTWLQFMTPEELATVSPLYNASFEMAPSGVPFDWTLGSGAGYLSELRPVPEKDNEHALYIEFTQGRADYKGVSQYTLLGPGTYTLRGEHKGALISKRGLRWRVFCAGQKPQAPPLAEGDLIRGDILDWREFTVNFTIPPTGCRAQQIRLDLDARSPSERLISGSIWIDKLDIKRAS